MQDASGNIPDEDDDEEREERHSGTVIHMSFLKWTCSFSPFLVFFSDGSLKTFKFSPSNKKGTSGYQQ